MEEVTPGMMRGESSKSESQVVGEPRDGGLTFLPPNPPMGKLQIFQVRPHLQSLQDERAPRGRKMGRYNKIFRPLFDKSFQSFCFPPLKPELRQVEKVAAENGRSEACSNSEP